MKNINLITPLSILGVLTLAGLLAAIKVFQFAAMGEAAASFAPPPATVTSIDVQESHWENLVYAPGELEALAGVTVSASEMGRIHEIPFTSGATVKKGDVLVKQNIETELAQLQAASAAEELAQKSLERAKPLLKSNDISVDEFDVLSSQFEQASAQVANIRSIINKKSVKAPFDGQLGISRVDVGQYLHSGDALVSIQDISSMLVNFSLPQKNYSRVSIGQSVRVGLEESEEIFDGRITAISPDVDPVTRNFRLQATVDNADRRLKPGMFVDVEIVVGTGTPVLIIPTSAVLYAPYGDSVFVIEAGEDNAEAKSIRQQFIRLGRSQGDFVNVLEGLEPGQTVVSTGLFKLFNGQNVVEDNQLSPDFSLNPSLKDS